MSPRVARSSAWSVSAASLPVTAAKTAARKAFIGLGTSGRKVQDEVALIDAEVAAGVQ